MRIDKFLKLSRIVKRRTVAAEMAGVGAVRIGGRVVKPSAEVRVGDVIEVAFPRRVVTASVVNADERAIKRGAECVQMQDDRRLEDGEMPWQ